MARVINFEGRRINVPDDATDEEVSEIIQSSGAPAKQTARPAAPRPTQAPSSIDRAIASPLGQGALGLTDIVAGPVQLAANLSGIGKDKVNSAVNAVNARSNQARTNVGNEAIAAEQGPSLERIRQSNPDMAAYLEDRHRPGFSPARFAGSMIGTGAVTSKISQLPVVNALVSRIAPGVTAADKTKRVVLGAGAGAASAGLAPIDTSQGEDYKSELADNMKAGAVMGAVVPAAIRRGGEYGRKRVAEALAQNQLNSVRNATLEEGRKAGYVVPPTEVNPSFINNRLESIAGKAPLKQEATHRNQTVTNKLAVEDLGLPKNTAITEGKLDTLRDRLAEPYRKVAALSPQAATDLENLKQIRAEKKQWDLHYNRSAEPNSLKEAKRLGQQADALEAKIDGVAVSSGQPDLVKQLRSARTEIAKTYDVQDALNVGDASISAPVLGRALDKGKPLSGGLKTIGKMNEAFRPFMGEGSRTPTPGVSALEPVQMTVGGAVGGTAGVVAGGLPLIRGPMRSLLLSAPYQRVMAQTGVSPSYAAQVLAKMPKSTTPEQLMQAILIGRAVAERKQKDDTGSSE